MGFRTELCADQPIYLGETKSQEPLPQKGLKIHKPKGLLILQIFVQKIYLMLSQHLGSSRVMRVICAPLKKNQNKKKTVITLKNSFSSIYSILKRLDKP